MPRTSGRWRSDERSRNGYECERCYGFIFCLTSTLVKEAVARQCLAAILHEYQLLEKCSMALLHIGMCASSQT